MPDTLSFELRREGVLDELGKWLGIVHEIQSGDAAFDRTLYVVGEHPALEQLLMTDAAWRSTVMTLFRRPDVQRLNPPIADPQIRPGSPGFIFGLPARNADLADHVQLGIGVRDQLRFSLRREHSVPDQHRRARRDLQRRMTNRGSIPDRWIPKITAREGLRPVMGK